MLATISKTDAFLYWICALLMVSLFLQNHMRTSVTYWTCWWMPSAKLIVFERWEDQNINNAELTSSRTCITWPDGCGRFWNETVHTGGMIGAHADGSHGLDKENHLQVPSLQTNRFWLTRVCPLNKISLFRRYGYTGCMFCKVANTKFTNSTFASWTSNSKNSREALSALNRILAGRQPLQAQGNNCSLSHYSPHHFGITKPCKIPNVSSKYLSALLLRSPLPHISIANGQWTKPARQKAGNLRHPGVGEHADEVDGLLLHLPPISTPWTTNDYFLLCENFG